jgi:hypothetical protein
MLAFMTGQTQKSMFEKQTGEDSQKTDFLIQPSCR